MIILWYVVKYHPCVQMLRIFQAMSLLCSVKEEWSLVNSFRSTQDSVLWEAWLCLPSRLCVSNDGACRFVSFIGSPARTTRSQSPVMSSRSPQKVWPFSCVCGLTFDVFTSIFCDCLGSRSRGSQPGQALNNPTGHMISETHAVIVYPHVSCARFPVRLAHEWCRAPDRTLQKPLIHYENIQPQKKWSDHFRII